MGNRRSRTVHHYHTPSYNATQHRLNNERTNQQQAHQRAIKDAENRQQARMSELANQREKQRQAETRLREQQQAQHQAKMRELQIMQDQQNKKLKEEQRKAAVASITNEINKLTNKLNNDIAEQAQSVKDLEETGKTLVENNKKIQQWEEYKKTELLKLDQQIGLSVARLAYDRDNTEVEAAINKTSVHEGNVGRFLRLTHGLIGATMNSQSESDKLEVQLTTFGEIMGRECQSKVTVDHWFNEKRLSRFVSICHDEDYKTLEDLECDNKEEFDEDILQMIEDGVKKDIKQWEETYGDDNKNDDNKDNKEIPKKPVDVTRREKKALEKICTKPKSWQEEQEQQTKIVKQSLLDITPLLGDFFGRMKMTMNQTTKLLTYTEKLNDDQLKAIKMSEEKIKSEEKKSNDDDDYDDNKAPDFIDVAERNKFILGSKCEIFSGSLKKWCSGKVLKIFTDDKGEWLEIEYDSNDEQRQTQVQRYSEYIRPESSDDLTVQCRSLTKASIVGINVVESMIGGFEKSETTKRALPIARGVEDCCLQIIHSQGDMRQNVLLAQNILKLKPSHFNNDESKKLWSAVDNGIIHIFECALKLVRVTQQYFAFFLKFKHSFQHFISCYEIDENTSLSIATQHIQKDVRAFSAFQKDFVQSIEDLRKQASKCISDCVSQQAGADTFEKAQESREITRKKYLAQQRIWNKKEEDLGYELDKLIEETIVESGKQKQLEYKSQVLKESTNSANGYIKIYRDALTKLNNM